MLTIITMRQIAQRSLPAFDLRCYIPEKMFTFVQQNYLPLIKAPSQGRTVVNVIIKVTPQTEAGKV
ncbi:hypothetical protein CIL06_20330 [Pantoea vagans]|nr:hypothetical protein CIL06_20330 [Pantoea vagans]